MKQALVANTGGLLRAIARRPNGLPAWPEYEKALVKASLVVIPSLILTEIDYFLRDHRPIMRKLVAEIFDPSTTYEFEPATPADVARALLLDAKFSALGLGLVDGTVAAVAERRRIYRVLTTDRADLGPLRIGEKYRKSLTLVP